MSTTRARPRTASTAASPRELGIGMRFSIHPHCDDFAEVILGAVHDAQAAGFTDGLVVETDAVSSYVGVVEAPAEQRLMAYLAFVIEAASRRAGGGHLVAQVLLSRGCPGEVSCDLSAVRLPDAAPVRLAPVGVPADAQWSLYPLLDAGSGAGEHMHHIEAAIAAASRRGTVTGTAHYATRLAGDVSEILCTVADAWAQVGRSVAHVVCHLTLSTGSPSAGAAR